MRDWETLIIDDPTAEEFFAYLDNYDIEVIPESSDLSSGKSIIERYFPRSQHTLNGGTVRRFPINVIPSESKGSCERILVVAIGYNEDCEKRLLEAIEHFSVKCRTKTQYVVFIAAWWDSKAWLNHATSFRYSKIKSFLKLPGQRILPLQ